MHTRIPVFTHSLRNLVHPLPLLEQTREGMMAQLYEDRSYTDVCSVERTIRSCSMKKHAPSPLPMLLLSIFEQKQSPMQKLERPRVPQCHARFRCMAHGSIVAEEKRNWAHAMHHRTKGEKVWPDLRYCYTTVLLSYVYLCLRTRQPQLTDKKVASAHGAPD